MAEHVTIAGWSFQSPCCWLEDIAGLAAAPTIVGEDRPVPSVDGEAVRPRRRGPIWIPLGPGIVIGDVDAAGLPHPSPRLGLHANWQALQDAILASAASPGTKTLVHELDDGSTRTAEVYVTAVDGPASVGSHVYRFGLTVKVPAGAFVAAGPPP